MSFSVKSEVIDNTAIIAVEGSLDSSTAPKLHDEVQRIILQNPKDLVLNVEKLNFMASAGLRVIIFAKQKLGSAAKLFLVKPQDQVVETLRMTGLLFSVTIVDQYPE
ncbi:MAG: STAS domain-containing protein [Bacteroidales bacterium]|jgi:anti-anti-sigma factor|nr:STAS domain-containing protein [Bacteroidales bacterium]